MLALNWSELIKTQRIVTLPCTSVQISKYNISYFNFPAAFPFILLKKMKNFKCQTLIAEEGRSDYASFSGDRRALFREVGEAYVRSAFKIQSNSWTF